MQKTKKQILSEARDRGETRSAGRPEVGDTILPKINVSSAVAEGLKGKAQQLGVSVPEARRIAYKLFTEER